MLKGDRTFNGLWQIDLPTPLLANYSKMLPNKTATEQIALLNTATSYPVLSTWINAIKNGHFATWPG